MIVTSLTVTVPMRARLSRGAPRCAGTRPGARALWGAAVWSKFVRPSGYWTRFARTPLTAMYVTSSIRESRARGATPISMDFTTTASPRGRPGGFFMRTPAARMCTTGTR